jgi:uncharacterized protein YndB with AHSA1/START domain
MFSTHIFGFSTGADPRQVWSALTDREQTRVYLQGVTLESTWAPGAPLVLRSGELATGAGEVLAVEPGARLSVAIEGGHGPDTYLTWTIRALDGGSVVRLYVDEPGGASDDERREVEDAWLPVLADLHALLAGAEVR